MENKGGKTNGGKLIDIIFDALAKNHFTGWSALFEGSKLASLNLINSG